MHRIGYHILFWALYVSFKTYLNLTAGASVLLPESLEDLTKFQLSVSAQLSFLTIKIPLVYACFGVIGQYLSHRLNRYWAIALLALLFALAVVLMIFLNHYFVLPVVFNYSNVEPIVFSAYSLLYHFFTLVFVVGVASSIKLLRRQYQSRLKELQLQKEKTETELKYLKGQINPHFLFNTLNNIYSLARKKSDHTPEAIMKLSQLMRFMLYEASSPQILLVDELKLIGDYIELEKLRYGDKLKIEFTTDIDNGSQTIAPLLLIHFVENAFKHGASESRFRSFISINIQLKEGLLSATIDNSKEENAAMNEDGKIGLHNIKRQLELIYPNHSLNLTNESTFFRVELKTDLKTDYVDLSNY